MTGNGETAVVWQFLAKADMARTGSAGMPRAGRAGSTLAHVAKKALTGAAGLLIAALSVTIEPAMAPIMAQAQVPHLTPQIPELGGTLHFAVVTEPPHYDCHGTTNFGISHTVFPHYSRLLKYDGDWRSSRIVGDLAETWTVSADGLAYTFKLLSGVSFHDGSTLTAHDVKATFERIVNPPEGVLSARQMFYRDIRAIETPDDATIIFRLDQANSSMLDAFASPWTCVYSAARLQEDPRFPETTIMGTGPFVFSRHIKGQSLESKRFDRYFRQGLPYLDGFKAHYVKPGTLVPGLTAGQFDIEFRGLSPIERDQVNERLKDDAVTREGPWNTALTITFNTRRPPYDDLRVRQALTMAIDRWGGAEALSKVSLLKHAGGFMRPGTDFALPESELIKMPGFGRDIDRSRTEASRLLTEAGFPRLKIVLLNRDTGQPYGPAGAFVVDQWKRAGLLVEQRQLDPSQYYDAISQGDFDAAIDLVSDFSDEPNSFYIRLLSRGRSPVSFAGHGDTMIDELFDLQKRALDRNERRRLVHAFETRALRQAFNVPLLWWQRIVVHHKKVKGWRLFASHHLGQDLAEVWLDQ